MALSDSGGVICRNSGGRYYSLIMNNNRFDILGCAVHGIRSVFAEWRYLSSVALMPVALTALIEIVKLYGVEKQSIVTELITLLPAGAMAAWFMFLQTRLLVFGERKGKPSVHSGEERRRAFEASMLLWLLVNMAGLAFIAFLLYWAKTQQAGSNPAVTAVGYLLIGAVFWGLRFSIVHILGAVGYSIRDYIYRVNGAMVSLRLLAMMLIVLLPVSLVASPVEAALFEAIKEEAAPLHVSGLLLMVVVLKFVFLSFFNAAGVFALREMLKIGTGKAQGAGR